MKKELYKIMLNTIVMLCGLMSVTFVEVVILQTFNAIEAIYTVLTVAAITTAIITMKTIGDVIFVYVYRQYYDRKWKV